MILYTVEKVWESLVKDTFSCAVLLFCMWYGRDSNIWLTLMGAMIGMFMVGKIVNFVFRMNQAQQTFDTEHELMAHLVKKMQDRSK